MAPPNRRRAATVRVPVASWCVSARCVISGMLDVPAATVRTKIPNRKGMSPVFVVMNALIAASEFSFSSHQCPINR